MKNLRTFERIWQTYSGEGAWQAVADLSRFHRIQASPGYRQAAEWIHQSLLRNGLDAEVLAYPADERTQFWTWSSFQEWDCSAATLHLIAPEKESQLLADFRANPISVIQRSAPYVGAAEVVLLEEGTEESDYDGLEVAGKVVLTRGELRRVWEMAVRDRGAVGILFDGMRPVTPVRPEGDLSDFRQYTSFWWQAGDVRCFGFVLTPAQGRLLRRLISRANGPDARESGTAVRVQAVVDTRLYDGTLEVVSAAIPGQTEEEIVIVAHLCHPRPSANDNASGAAAALEAAHTLHTLISSGQLPPPRRTIRFLWLPEMTGSLAYLASREGELARMVAGLNLDMVGEDQDQTGSVWLIERPPDAAASFAPDLLAHLREELPQLKGATAVAPTHTDLGGYPLYRLAEVPFSGGSDHYIFSDPTVGVPMPMLIQWPDRFYHTSADTPDRTDPQSLARAGSLAAMYSYWLATAGTLEATWLGYEMLARFKARVIATAAAGVTKVLSLEEDEAMAQAMLDLDRRLAYLLDRQKAALRTLDRLAPVECLEVDLLAEAERVTNHELSWVWGLVNLQVAALGLKGLATVAPRERSAEEERAAEMIPTRLSRAPVPLGQYLHLLEPEEREAWRRLLKDRGFGTIHTLSELALYWADGTRSILDIASLVEHESGVYDVELLLAFFRVLGKLGLVAFDA